VADTDEDPSTKSTSEIRIVGLNTDKTRRTLGSYTVYQVYFELSGNPPLAWRDSFGREWKDLNPTQEAGIDGRFLVMHCPLQEIATTHLPALKKAIEATNVGYREYAREQFVEEEHRADVWKQERKAVEDMAKSLRFDQEMQELVFALADSFLLIEE
jgi:hypothetical protein